MPPIVATIVYSCGVAVLFWLDRELRSRLSAEFLVPLAWLLINGSRPVTAWLGGHSISPDQMLEGSPIDRSIFLLLQIAGLVILFRRWPQVEKIVRANGPLLLFALYGAFSVAWSDYPGVAFKRWIKMLGDITMVLIVVSSRDRTRAMKRILITSAFILIPASILLDKYYPMFSTYYDPFTGVPFVSGVGQDKNMLGMTCLVYGLAVLWQLLAAYKAKKGRERTRRLIAYGIVFGMVIFLFRSANSMTSIMCFAMGSSVLLVTTLLKNGRRPPLVHMMVAGIVGVAFAVLFLHVGEGAALQSLGRNPTLTGRTEIWAAVLHFAGNPVLGTGFESFWLGDRMQRIWSYGEMTYGINEAHNGYLETYLNLGWIGVALLGGLIVTGYRNILGALRIDPETARLRLALFVIAVVYGFTEVGFRINCTVWIAFLMAILAIPLPPRPRKKKLKGSDALAGRAPEESLTHSLA
jgi:exopolysaccharide production protein ExoQ